MKAAAPETTVSIGVTGSIGSGKSRVSRFLAQGLACPLVDADQVARLLMAPGNRGWLAIQALEPNYIQADGCLDRARLRRDIFFQPALRKAVDAHLHPLILADIQEALATITTPWAVLEVPLLFEAGWEDFFTHSILVYAARDVCLRRVMARDGVDLHQAKQAFACQMEVVEKIKRANHVIDNGGCWWDTQLQLIHMLDIFTGQAIRVAKKA